MDLARCSTAAQLEKIVRGMRRAQANEQAERDPEAAAWSLRTRLRYDDNGNFALTIRGPAELLPVVQAGIDAKRSEMQRQRDAEAAEAVAGEAAESAVAGEVAEDVPADIPTTDKPAPAADRQPQPQSRPEPEDPVDLDEPAPGWPAGTTRRDVQAAMHGFFAAVQQWQPTESYVDEPDLDRPAPSAASSTVDGVSAETPAAPEAPAAERVTDAEALLALAQDALTGEQVAHPDIARRRRPQLTAQIDPLSGWGRLADGELLPPTSLRAVMKTLPGRGGAVRLRPVTPADLRRHDWAAPRAMRIRRCASCSGPSTVSAAASPAAPGARSCTPTTSSTGATAGQPTWTTWCSSALDTTP